MANVRISELNQLSTWTQDDFFPVVDSASLTTFRTPISTMITYIGQSGSVVSASWSSASISSSYAPLVKGQLYEITASWSLSSSVAISSSYAKTSSVSISSSLATSASYAKSSSWAEKVIGINQVANGGSYDISCSWASASLSSSVSISSSYASRAAFAVTASYADRAAWAKNAETAAFVPGISDQDPDPEVPVAPGVVRAWGMCYTNGIKGGLDSSAPGENWNHFIVSGESYNIASLDRTNIYPPVNFNVPSFDNTTRYEGKGSSWHWILTFANPLPSTNYIVTGFVTTVNPNDYGHITMYPFTSRTNTQCTISITYGDFHMQKDKPLVFNISVFGT